MTPRDVRSALPGLLLCAGGATLAVLANRAVPAMSALLAAIVLGALIANLWHVPEACAPGVRLSAKRLLRLGIVLLGLQLVIGQVLGLGWRALVLVVVVVAGGMAGTVLIGRLCGLSRGLSLLVGCGFSICGAAAVAGVEPLVDADDEEVATAIALVVLYGTLMIPVLPLLAHLIGLGARAAGLWAGSGIQEVAQVVAAGAALGSASLAIAVVVKLTRVLMLAPVALVLSAAGRRHAEASQRPPLVPLFVVGFIAMVAVASLHLVPAPVLSGAKVAQTALLAAAMFALGLGVDVRKLVAVGPRPFLVGLLGTVWMAGLALAGVLLLG